jgi:hypothetical protein
MRRSMAALLGAAALLMATTAPVLAEDTQDDDLTLSWLFALDAGSGSVDGSTLTLSEVGDEVLLFSDRPQRRVSRLSLAEFVSDWDLLFAGSPPDAAIAWAANSSRADAAVELTDPLLDADDLSFTVTPLHEVPERVDSLVTGSIDELPETLSAVDLFIDSSSTDTVTMTFRMCDVGTGGKCEVPPANVIDSLNSGMSDDVIELFNGSGYIHPASDGSVAVPSGAGKVSAGLTPSCESTLSGYEFEAPDWVTVIDWVKSSLGASSACSDGSVTGPAGPSTFTCEGDWTTVTAGGHIDCSWSEF